MARPQASPRGLTRLWPALLALGALGLGLHLAPRLSLRRLLPVAPAVAAGSIGPEQVGVVINSADPLSERIGEYYRLRRGIPARNLLRVSLPSGRTQVSPEEFAALREDLERQTPPSVRVYALTWAAPYRVGCMSITSAFTFGFDERFCAQGCKMTAISPFYGYRAWTGLPWRPTMAIAARSFDQAKALIDRGVASDGTRPTGTAYLATTDDKARNVRSVWFPKIESVLGPSFRIVTLPQPEVGQRDDVMFYFVGLAQVPGLNQLRFRPGAIADHLTSLGGQLTDSSQMSSLAWLEAGATGSYGAVVEPCNFLSKFPNPGIAMQTYLRGETLIEAYWRSVQQPGQGIFIGEPLARPFGR